MQRVATPCNTPIFRLAIGAENNKESRAKALWQIMEMILGSS
jgi:hypothetical protein